MVSVFIKAPHDLRILTSIERNVFTSSDETSDSQFIMSIGSIRCLAGLQTCRTGSCQLPPEFTSLVFVLHSLSLETSEQQQFKLLPVGVEYN